jgi:KAP family P-loop domain
MNSRQKRIVSSWLQLLQDFTKREWISLFVSSAIGVIAAESIHLLWRDHSFQCYVLSKYKSSVSFDDPRYYVPYLVVFFLLMLVAVGPIVCMNIGWGIKSWLRGVTSGLLLLGFVSTFSLSILPSTNLLRHTVLGCALLGGCFLVSYLLYMWANVCAGRTIHEDEFRVPSSVRSLAGSQLEWSDDPIQTWPQDALGRAALVDSLSVKIMIAKSSVLALSGRFGSGKTSLLNLLREHLGNKTITVSFSTWLPGSQETLTSYLLADVSNECKKQWSV